MCEEKGGDDAQSALQEHDFQKMRPPNRKKFEEEMEEVQLQIKDREAQIESLRKDMSVTEHLRSIREEKSIAIAARGKISADLEKFNRTIPEKMIEMSKLESCLYYRSEVKINDTIQRLEGSLQVQRFKLSEEKKIVTEIDKLRRSKRTLAQYQCVRQEIGVLRDQQRRMREERDVLFREVARMKEQEHQLRVKSSQAKSSFTSLKKVVDELYERRRKLVSEYRREKDLFLGVRDQRRRDSWRRREDEKRNILSLKNQLELDEAPMAYDAEIHICSTLYNHLMRLKAGSQESSVESPASSLDDPELAGELDGQFVLLRRSDEVEGQRVEVARRPSRKSRRSRRQSMIRKIVHTPEVLADFIFLGLEAPSTSYEISECMEKVIAKKAYFERGQQLLSESFSDTGVSAASEVSSDAGVSATESLICELSRQASKTESCDDTRPAESVINDLLMGCQDDQTGDQATEDNACQDNLDRQQRGSIDEGGAVGGESRGSDTSDTLSPQSDDVEIVREDFKEDTEAVDNHKKSLSDAPSLLLTQPSFDGVSGEPLINSWPSAAFSRQRERRSMEQVSGAHLTGDGITAVARRNSWRQRQQKKLSESVEAKRPTELWTALPTAPISIESPHDFPSLTPNDESSLQTPGSGQWTSGHQTLAQRLSSPDHNPVRRRSLTKTLSSPVVTAVADREPKVQNRGHPILKRLSPCSRSISQSLEFTNAASRRLNLNCKTSSGGDDSSPLSLDSKDFPPLSQSSPRGGGSLRSSVSSQDPTLTDAHHSPRERVGTLQVTAPSLPNKHQDKLSTERWVAESSATYSHDIEPDQPLESTRL